MAIFRWFLKAGLGGYANWVSVAGIGLVLMALGTGIYIKGRVDGKNLERISWEKHVDTVIENRWKAKVKADTQDLQTRNQGNTAIEQRREGLDNAKQDLPDQGLTDRQRARGCAELQRQGRGC